jgi:imidazolonepropionase-like amidohydrolase
VKATASGIVTVVTLVHAGTLLVTPGSPPLVRQTIVVRADKIVEVRPGFVEAAAFAGPVRVVDLSKDFVLPGLMDVHMHIVSPFMGDRIHSAFIPDIELAFAGARHAREMLQAGITTIRDVGDNTGVSYFLRDAIARGDVPGPRIFAAGRLISRTGGHGAEAHVALGVAHPFTPGGCDGPESCRRVVRENIEAGSDLIKITASGSASEAWGEKDAVPMLFPDELAAMVAAATQLGRAVAVHAHSTASINMALRAGVRSIEHGTYFDAESARLFKQTGAYLDPTSFIGDLMLTDERIRERNLPEDWARISKSGQDQKEVAGRAWRAGITLVTGTDTGPGLPADAVIRELEIFVADGIPAAEALKAATVNGAALLGKAEVLGQLRAGYLADIIATPDSPLESVSGLRKVSFVMKDGVIYRSTP